MTSLAAALIAELDDPELDALAALLAPRLVTRLDIGAASPAWFDARGAAAHLATSKDRIYDLVQLGKLTPRRDGRRLLFRRSDLDAYLEASV